MPRVSIITTIVDPRPGFFEASVQAVLAQTHGDWEWLLVVADPAGDSPVRRRAAALAESDARVRIVTVDDPETAAALNAALDEARGEFVTLLGAEDTLDRRAIAASCDAIDATQSEGAPVDFCYADHDLITMAGETKGAYLKPVWSPERLRHHFYTLRFALWRRTVLLDLGGFQDESGEASEYDVTLRVTERGGQVVHVPDVLYHWREKDGSTPPDPRPDPGSYKAGLQVVQAHLDRLSINAQASLGATPFTYQIDRVPDSDTTVSVIIPTAGSRAAVWGRTRTFVTEAIRSVLQSSQHRSVEFIVVYDPSTPLSVLTELRILDAEVDARIRLIEFREPFNFSAKCNVGAYHASGDVLVLLNDDMEVRSEGFLEHLIAPLQEDGVGITGAKLVFESGLIQHAGVIYGAGTIHHSYYGYPGDDLGVHGELTINRECSGLTAACIAVRRETYDAVGGFNEALPGSYNDVDFTQKVRWMGLRLVWLHDVELYHFESISRDPTLEKFETEAIIARWDNYRLLNEGYLNSMRTRPKAWTRPRKKAASKKP